MKLSSEEANLFYKLLFHLQYYVFINSNEANQKISIKEYITFSISDKMKYRDELWSNNKWIDNYVNENPDNLFKEELEIIESWEKRVNERFIVERILKKYAVFISDKSEVYGVIGITEDIEDIITPNEIPAFLETVLLPFKNKIIYDGLLSRYSMSFGKGIREMFKETYNKAKIKNQIITSM
jgi:hypothetical protein